MTSQGPAISWGGYEEGYFSAYRHLLADDPDLVAHCGDYIYESPSGLAVQPRKHVIREPFELRDYRLRYAQYRTDADLAEAHRLLPWIFTYDDHEVDNNWAADISEHYPTVSREEFLLRRTAAFQAYYEHLPLRPSRAPSRTLLGPSQEAWLRDGLRASATRWDVLVHQVPFTQLDEAAGPGFLFGKDNWNYFPAARQRIVDELVARPDLNAIVIGGEIHRHLAVDVNASGDDPAPIVASEFVATSVASGGNGNAGSTWVTRILAENPHIKYAWEQRGYIRAEISPQEWRSDLRVVPVVTTPDGDAITGASYVVEAGRRGLQPA